MDTSLDPVIWTLWSWHARRCVLTAYHHLLKDVGMPAGAMLIKPVQRLMRYPMLLRELLRTKPQHGNNNKNLSLPPPRQCLGAAPLRPFFPGHVQSNGPRWVARPSQRREERPAHP